MKNLKVTKLRFNDLMSSRTKLTTLSCWPFKPNKKLFSCGCFELVKLFFVTSQEILCFPDVITLKLSELKNYPLSLFAMMRKYTGVVSAGNGHKVSTSCVVKKWVYLLCESTARISHPLHFIIKRKARYDLSKRRFKQFSEQFLAKKKWYFHSDD